MAERVTGDHPKAIVLSLSPGCIAFFCAVGAVFTLAGLVAKGGWGKWIVVAFGATPLVLMLINVLFPSATYLEMTAEGFAVRMTFARRFVRWADVSGIEVDTSYLYGKERFVRVSLDERSRAGRWRTPCVSIMPWMFGLSADRLCDIMTRLRDAARQAAQTSTHSAA